MPTFAKKNSNFVLIDCPDLLRNNLVPESGIPCLDGYSHANISYSFVP
jgi:hypothetical protein